MYDKAEIRVLPTKTIGEGYAAISVFDPSCGDADELFEGLLKLFQLVVFYVLEGEEAVAIFLHPFGEEP